MAKRAFHFDGNEDRVIIAPAAPLGLVNDFTVSWWWNHDAFDAVNLHQVIGDDEGTYRLAISGGVTHTIYFYNAGLDIITPTAGNFTTGVWYHMMAIRTGTTLTLYRDLVADGTAVVDAGAWVPNLLGRGFDGAEITKAIDGKLFDVRIYDGALNSADRATVNAFGTVSEPLVRWYKCNKTDASIAFDSSPSSVNGTKIATLPAFHYSGHDVPFDYTSRIRSGPRKSIRQNIRHHTGSDPGA